jgi:hypothetical protein
VIRALNRAGRSVDYRIDGFFKTESDAHGRECELIRSIGRHDKGCGPLTNQTDGGEGVSNPSEQSQRQRAATLAGDADDPDRRAVNEFFHSSGKGHDSIPIKPLRNLKLVPSTPHPRAWNATPRTAQTLLAGVVARQIPLTPGCEIPRVFQVGEIKVAIENGAARVILKSGLATLLRNDGSPKDEVFVLTDYGYRYVLSAIGTDRLLDLGVIEPEV